MKKKTFLFAIIAVLFASFDVVYGQIPVIDNPIINSVSAGDIQGGEYLGIGNPDYEDSFVQSAVILGTPVTVISSTTPYTILSLSFFFYNDSGAYVKCGDDDLISGMNSGRATALISPFARSYDVQLHCSSDLVFYNSDFGVVEVQYVPYDTRVGSKSTLSDVVFGLGIIIVILFLAVVGFVFNKVIGRKKW